MHDNASAIYDMYLETYLINTWLFQIIKKESWVTNMILLIYFLKNKIMKTNLKMKN